MLFACGWTTPRTTSTRGELKPPVGERWLGDLCTACHAHVCWVRELTVPRDVHVHVWWVRELAVPRHVQGRGGKAEGLHEGSGVGVKS